jgi:hypothetical protein
MLKIISELRQKIKTVFNTIKIELIVTNKIMCFTSRITKVEIGRGCNKNHGNQAHGKTWKLQ